MNFEELTSQETEAFEQFRQKYKLMHPVKAKPRASGLDWKFYLVLLVTPMQILLAALRTASIFYKAAELGGNQTLAYIEAGLAIFAVEVALVVYSAVQAAKRTEVPEGRLTFGIILMVLISVFAGLSQSITLITGVDKTFLTYLQYGVSFMIGIGASIIAWIGGEVLGEQVALMGIRANQIDEQYRVYLQEYNEGMLNSWANSPERKIARGELVNAVRSVFGPTERTNEKRTERPRLPNEGQNEVRLKVMEYIKTVYERDGRIPGPSEISRQLRVSKGYAHQVRYEWMQENAGVL
jgi:hypothetical protein